VPERASKLALLCRWFRCICSPSRCARSGSMKSLCLAETAHNIAVRCPAFTGDKQSLIVSDTHGGMFSGSSDIGVAWRYVSVRLRQVGDILRVLDAKKLWSMRNKYATLRPTGWRSDPGRVVPAKCAPPF